MYDIWVDGFIGIVRCYFRYFSHVSHPLRLAMDFRKSVGYFCLCRPVMMLTSSCQAAHILFSFKILAYLGKKL